MLAPALCLTGLLRSRASPAGLKGQPHLALRERGLARHALLAVLALRRLGRLLGLRARPRAAGAARGLAALVQLQQVVGVAEDVVHLLDRAATASVCKRLGKSALFSLSLSLSLFFSCV